MSAKQIVKKFYKSNALIDSEVLQEYLHPDIIVEWNSSKGLIELKYNTLIDLSIDLSKAYVRSKVRINHVIAQKDLVSIQYSHFVKTIENPREEMLLARFFAIWQVKEGKLFRGYLMSQLS
jgi:predicted SnoaL-like aldol condensation-catalyzing enzyme